MLFRSIQLCDAMAGAQGVMDMEERMGDVKRRYGYYPEEKWDFNLALKRYFEEKAGEDIYILVEKDSYKPEGSVPVPAPKGQGQGKP